MTIEELATIAGCTAGLEVDGVTLRIAEPYPVAHKRMRSARDRVIGVLEAAGIRPHAECVIAGDGEGTRAFIPLRPLAVASLIPPVSRSPVEGDTLPSVEPPRAGRAANR